MKVEIDRSSMKSVRLMLAGVQSQSPKILSRSLNATATKTRTEGSKEIRKQVNLKAAYVRSRLTLRKASQNKLSASIATPVRGLLLSHYSTDRQIAGSNVSWIKPPKVPTRGIRVKVQAGTGTKVVTGGDEIKGKPFYMVLPNSRRVAIVGRRASAGASGGKIKVLYGPSLSQVFDDVVGDLSEPMNDYLAEQIEKNTDAVLRGY